MKTDSVRSAESSSPITDCPTASSSSTIHQCVPFTALVLIFTVEDAKQSRRLREDCLADFLILTLTVVSLLQYDNPYEDEVWRYVTGAVKETNL